MKTIKSYEELNNWEFGDNIVIGDTIYRNPSEAIESHVQSFWSDSEVEDIEQEINEMIENDWLRPEWIGMSYDEFVDYVKDIMK